MGEKKEQKIPGSMLSCEILYSKKGNWFIWWDGRKNRTLWQSPSGVVFFHLAPFWEGVSICFLTTCKLLWASVTSAEAAISGHSTASDRITWPLILRWSMANQRHVLLSTPSAVKVIFPFPMVSWFHAVNGLYFFLLPVFMMWELCAGNRCRCHEEYI